MTKITIHPGQSLLDISLQHLGGMSLLFRVAQDNGLSITDRLQPGGELILSPEPEAARVVKYIRDKRVMIGTATVPALQGIGYWAIGMETKVG